MQPFGMDKFDKIYYNDIEIKLKTPFYKNKFFYIILGALVLIIIVIVIIVVVTSKSVISFSSDDFKESILYKSNPDQGFYYPIGVQITPSEIIYRKKIIAQQIYHLRCDISQFSKAVNGDKDLELTQTALDNINELLTFVKNQNKNAVIRFAYDPLYDGNLNQEPSMEMIETHIKQLSPVIQNYYHTITAIEAGMLGPWGEMHTSELASEENKAKVFHYWLQNTKNIPILSRTPKAIFYYFGKNLTEMEEIEIKKSDEGYNLGVFNDCYLSSYSDEGTYRFNRTREVNWLSKQNEHLPYGGETCAVDSMNDLENAIPEMYKLSLSYLNSDYKKDVLTKWNNSIYNSMLGIDSIFYGVTGFDYIQAHMGYRLVLKSIKIVYNKGGKYELTININNVGFGNLLKEKKFDIIYTDMNNSIIIRNYLGKYNGENEFIIKGELLSEDHDDYKVFIKIYGLKENSVDYYFVQFANENIFNEQINSNYLFKVSKGGEIQK